MANKGGQDRAFYPDVMYPLGQVAENLMVSEKWVKENLIQNGSCAYKRQGNSYLFLGQWLINWCRADFDIPVEHRPPEPAGKTGNDGTGQIAKSA